MNMYYSTKIPGSAFTPYARAVGWKLLRHRLAAIAVGSSARFGFTYVMLPLRFSLSLAHAIFLMSDDNAAGRVSRSNDITSIAVCQSRILLTDD